MKHYLAIDYGEKFIGLAQFRAGSDPFVLCMERIQNHGRESVFYQLKSIVEIEGITDIIVGVPYLLDGGATSTSKKMIDFANQLIQFFQLENMTLEIHQQDETLSTFQAQEVMKNSPQYNFRVDMKKIDSVSAKIILEDFLGQKS